MYYNNGKRKKRSHRTRQTREKSIRWFEKKEMRPDGAFYTSAKNRREKKILIQEDALELMKNMDQQELAGFEIATHWSPMRPKIEHWRLNFQNWSPAGDSCFVR